MRNTLRIKSASRARNHCASSYVFCSVRSSTGAGSIRAESARIAIPSFTTNRDTAQTRAPPNNPGKSMEFQRFSSPDAVALEANMAEIRSKLERALAVSDANAIVEHAADLGSMLTTARQEDAAVALLDPHRALADALPEHEASGWFWNALATALQYTGQREQANAIFAQALSQCQTQGWSRLQSFVLQHWGCSLVEQGELRRAHQLFVEALAIRQQLDDPRQASTQRALAELAQLLDEEASQGRQPL